MDAQLCIFQYSQYIFFLDTTGELMSNGHVQQRIVTMTINSGTNTRKKFLTLHVMYLQVLKNNPTKESITIYMYQHLSKPWL